jgi:sigma-B regulation protein RsbU (phosphoserine phosphatase)
VRIRWKLFWLLAALSLAPLLVLRVNSQFAMTRLAERLSGRVGAHLVAEAKLRLGRTVEDHARLLAARRQTLALAVALQAGAVEKALAVPPAKADLSGALLTTALPGPGMGMGRPAVSNHGGFADNPGYFRLDQEGRHLPLPIDTGRVLLRLPPGAGPESLPPQAAALAGLARPLAGIAALVGPLAHFQNTILADGTAAVYPAVPGWPRRSEPLAAGWYRTATAATAPVWSPPQGEPGTGRVSVAVAAPLRRPDGSVAGATAIFTPLDDLLASVTSPEHISGEVETLLVKADSGDTIGPPRLLVEAGEVVRATRHGGHGWLSFVHPAPLVADDAPVLAAMAADVAAGRPGVARLPYNGRDCLAAYARTGEAEALMQIAPVADLLAEAAAVAGDVNGSIRQLYTVGSAIAGAVMLALLFVSLAASRAVTRPILALTAMARRLAAGDFSARVPAKGRDEIAELGRVFNDLAPTLDAHMHLCESVELASQIQKSLLPAQPPAIPGLALAAVCRYCDATGGDSYDILPFDGPKAGLVGLAVGDVTGHGLEAALLMTTARALLRPRARRPGHAGRGPGRRQPGTGPRHHGLGPLHDPVLSGTRPENRLRRLCPGRPRSGHGLGSGNRTRHGTDLPGHDPRGHRRRPLRDRPGGRPGPGHGPPHRLRRPVGSPQCRRCHVRQGPHPGRFGRRRPPRPGRRLPRPHGSPGRLPGRGGPGRRRHPVSRCPASQPPTLTQETAMPVTENDAKFKFCPLLKTQDDKMKFCQGAMCMMWRAVDATTGYCGLAGHPVARQAAS